MPTLKRVPASQYHPMRLELEKSKYRITNLISCISLNWFQSCIYRAKRRKKIAKAIERQARKLRAKGITVDVEALRSEYVAQHRGQLLSSDSEDNDEDPIDVVGGTDLTDEESQDYTTSQDTPHQRNESVEHLMSCNSNSNDTSKHSLRPNPFSIENILFKNTWKIIHLHISNNFQSSSLRY